MAQPDFEVNILPFDPQTTEEMDLRPTLERLYLPEAVFADWAIRTGERTFNASYRVRDFHCDPLKTPQLRGVITVDGNRVTNFFIIDAEDPQGRPPHTIGHLRRFPLFPGNLGIGSIIEAISYDQPMDLIEFDSIDFKGPGQPKELLLAAATIARNEVNRRVINEALVTISRREHAKGTNLVFVSSTHPRGISLPQFRLFEIGAQLAGAGMQTLIGPLPEGYAVIYEGVGPSTFVSDEIKPEDVLKGEVTLFDMSRLGKGKYLFSLDLTLLNGEREIGHLEDVSLGLFPEEEIIKAINETLGGAS